MASVPSTPRIYADFNGFGGPDCTGGSPAVALDTLGTARDLANAGLSLAEGLRLTIYDWSDEDEDLEAEATARYDPDGGLGGPSSAREATRTCRSETARPTHASSACAAGTILRPTRRPGAWGCRV